MLRFPYKTWLLAIALVLMPWTVQAAGLGQLRILSAIGQPLVGEIELISVQKDELSTLTARLASPEAFRQANIQYSPALIGVRLSIERRASGQPYIRVTSSRPVNEPFVDLLIELSWAQGRLVREYTALIDPPEYQPGAAPTPPVAVVPVVPPAAPQTQPLAPAPQAAAPASPSAASPAPKAAPKAGAKEYGPVKRGDTLNKIAASVKPEGVTLEQTLVSLYRTNPDAFIGNANRLKTGRILRVPEKEEIASTGQADAVKEMRVQTANWNAYRQKLADAAGETPARESKSTASGKIATTVEDKAMPKEAPKDVVRLSKGEAGAAAKGDGKGTSPQARLRALEEEATAREKALADANDRIAQLEKTIKDMQRLLELKGQVPPPPVPPAKVATAPTPEPAKAAPPKAEPPKAEPAKTEPAKTELPKAEPGKATPPVEPPKAETKGAPVEPPKDVTKAEPPKSEQAPPPAEQPKPKPKVVAPPPPPPPEPSLLDQIMSEPLYLGAGAFVLILLGGIGYVLSRRRSTAAGRDDDQVEKQAPKLGKTAAVAAAAAPAMAAAPLVAAPAVSDDVDPLAEADLYLNFGRDAQAEEVLKEALEKNPRHEEAQLKLMQIYATRKDKAAFEKAATRLNEQTGGAGENWLKAAALGYSFDPENPLYAAGKTAAGAAAAMPAGTGAPAGTDLDFDLELAPTAGVPKTDLELDAGKTQIMQPGELAEMAAGGGVQDITADSGVGKEEGAAGTASPDFTLNAGAPGKAAGEPDITLDAPIEAALPVSAAARTVDATGDSASPMMSAIDFNFETAQKPAPAPEGAKGFTHDGTVILTPENQEKANKLDLDFDTGGATAKVDIPAAAEPDANTSTVATNVSPDLKLDFGNTGPVAPEFKLDDINLNVGETAKPAEALQGDVGAATGGAGPKDDHWYDVQTKFDLAKAYQEMGDKDGAREILQEVIKEGDAGQQAEAKQLLDALG